MTVDWLEFAKNYFGFTQECWGHGPYEFTGSQVFRSDPVCPLLMVILGSHGQTSDRHFRLQRDRFLTVFVSPTLCLPLLSSIVLTVLSPGEDQTSLQGMYWHGYMWQWGWVCVGSLSSLAFGHCWDPCRGCAVNEGWCVDHLRLSAEMHVGLFQADSSSEEQRRIQESSGAAHHCIRVQ